MQQTSSTTFEKRELERYSRHLLLPGFGREGQEKLKKSSVVVIGAGALGAPVLLYLAAAGVGRIRIIDPDQVADHNLQRQVLFRTGDIGRFKAEVAKEALESLNPWIHVEAERESFDSENGQELLQEMDLLIDGSDNFPTRYLANDASVLSGIPNIHASVFRFEGQIAIFNATDEKGERSVDYRDLFPEPPPPGSVPGCNEGGVLGMLPGIMGSLQANEAIKILSGMGASLGGELLIFDALTTRTKRVEIPKDPDHPGINRLVDQQGFCGIPPSASEQEAPPSVTPEALKQMSESGSSFDLVDVREVGEREIVHIGGRNIPLDQLPEAGEQIPMDRPVILYCRSGQRSARAVSILEQRYPHGAFYNLQGGILAWVDRIDPSLPSY
ncbi:MAG: ThiF family adenylyltransferase [Flavobacteriales bacterium]